MVTETKRTIAIFTEPEVTNCFSKIALVIIRENKTKIPNFLKILINLRLRNIKKMATILKTENPHCKNHLAVIIARENEVRNQSARAIFDNHQCNFTKKYK